MATESGTTLSTDVARAIARQDPETYNAGLAAVQGMTAQRLRARFGDEKNWQHEMLGDGQFENPDLPDGRQYKRAAVLVPWVLCGVLAVVRKIPPSVPSTSSRPMPTSTNATPDASSFSTTSRFASPASMQRNANVMPSSK